MTKQKSIIAVVIIAVVVLGGIFFTQRGSQKPPQPEKIKIGIVTMTTGNLAFLGDNVVKSARLAAEKLDRAQNIEFIVEDVGDLDGQGTKAISAAHKLIDTDHVQFIIDGMTSNGTLAIAPILDQTKVVAVTPLTGGENIDTAAEYLFRNGPSDIKAGTLPARDLAQKFGFTKVALLSDNADYTTDIAKHFRATYTGDIISDQLVKPDGNDYRTELLKIKAAAPQALVVNTADGVSSKYIVKQARDLGITAPIFANFIAFGPDLLKYAGAAADDMYVYLPEFNGNTPEVKEFMTAYKTKYGADSPIAFHATGTYDAVKMGLEAIDHVGYDGVKIHDYLLANIKNWHGFNGAVSFDARGNSGTGFVLNQNKNGVLVEVK